MSLMFLLMPLEEETFVTGIVFWAGLLGGSVLQVIVNALRKAFFKRNDISYKNAKKSRAGILRIFSNRLAMIADITCGVALLATSVSMIATRGYGYICYVFISLTVFSFALHCIFNGKNFDFILNKSKICNILDKRYKQNYTEKERGRNDEK
jgi:hypothetical protein